MEEERTLYESESHRTIPEVIDFLHQLAHWLGDRRLTFEEGEVTIVIQIPDEVVLEIEIEEEDEGDNQVKRSLEIGIEWVEGRASSPAAGTAMVRGSEVDAPNIASEEEE